MSIPDQQRLLPSSFIKEKARLLGFFDCGISKASHLIDDELRMENAKSTLYYNEPYTITETIAINLFELADVNYVVEFMLYFGGKKSPLMSSTYKMKLDNIDLNDLNNALTSIDENRYVYDISDDIENSEAARIKRIIGR